MYKLIRKNWGFFVVVLFSIIPLLPLFHGGFFPIHDDTQVARIFEMGKSLNDGMVPVRWIQDLGYGYGDPMFTFYAPLAFYIGGLFTLIGFSALLATKIMMGIAIILSGVFMYYFVRSVWGEMGGVFSAALYLYAPYHALDIYVRGDVAEFWAYAFIPLAFLGVYNIYKTQKVRFIVMGAVGFAGIILSHNLTALMVTPFLLLFDLFLILLSKNKFQSTFYLLSSISLGLLLSAFYWLPVPFEIQYTNVISQVGGGADFHNHFVCLNQLWNSPWGYGGSAAGCVDGISFALGKIYILFAVLGIICLPFLMRKERANGLLLLAGLSATGVSIFLLLSFSIPVWNTIHILAFLQYPWRFLLIVYFFLSFSAGAVFWILPRWKMLILALSLGLLIIVQGKYFVPQKYLSVDSSYYTNTYALNWRTSQITHEYMPKGFLIPKTPQNLPIQQFSFGKTQEKSLWVDMKKPGKLLIALAYFPAWKAYVDEQSAPIMKEKSGISVAVSQGRHTIQIRYQETFIEKLADCITGIGIAITILAIIWTYKKKFL